MPDLQFAPGTGAFAVMRMDPVAMVRHLGDPEATRAAENLTLKSYIVFVDLDSFLSYPGKPWYGFTVYLVGPCLPPHDCNFMTSESEMCIPIFPNASHPDGREPVRPQPIFPFDNCYVWSGLSMKIRAWSRPGGIDWEHTILLGAEEHAKWKHYKSEDIVRRICAQRALTSQAGGSPHVSQTDQVDESAGTGDDTGSMYANSYFSYSSYASEYAGSQSVNETDLFLYATENFELQALFQLRGDLESAYLKQDDIPNPMHLLEECDAITRIIQEVRERDPSLPLLMVPNPVSDAAPPESEDGASIRSWLSKIKPLRLHTPKVRKVRRQLRNLLRLPYILVWP